MTLALGKRSAGEMQGLGTELRHEMQGRGTERREEMQGPGVRLQREMHELIDDTRRHMLVLHEEVLPRCALLQDSLPGPPRPRRREPER